MTKFMEGFMWGDIHPDEIDDYIHAWHHEYHGSEKLHEFLGMTWEEYKAWVEGRPLEDIRNERRAQQLKWPYTWLWKVVSRLLSRLIPHP